MWTRSIIALVALLLGLQTAEAQPWSPKDAKADAALEARLQVDVTAGAIKRTGAKPGVRLEIADSAKLARGLKSSGNLLTNSYCDAVVVLWRDDPANRPFWTAYLQSIAAATGRPREQGFADLFAGVAASGSAAAAVEVRRLYSKAQQEFRQAKDPSWEAAAFTEIGNLELSLEAFDAADAAYARAAELYTEGLSPGHPLVASVVRNRGNVAFRQQKYGEAIDRYRESLKALGADNGPHALEIAACLQNLASAYMGNQDAPAAKEALERGLAIIRKAEGEKSVRQLPFLEVLGQVYQSRHESRLSRETAARALELARGAFGQKSVDSLRYLNALASQELALGEGETALRLHREALEILEQQPMRNETDIADIHAALGEDLQALANSEAALAEYQRALEGYRRGVSRRDQVGNILTLQKLASLAGLLGKTEESKSRYREAMAATAKLFSPTHPFLIILRRQLALQLLQEGAHADGAAELKAARELVDRKASEMQWADLTADFAMALDMAGDTDAAEREVSEAITVYQREQHPHLAGAYATLASLHRKRDEYQEAARVQRLALEIQKKALGPDHTMTLILRSMVAGDERQAGNHAEAEKMFQELLDLQKQRVGTEHPEYIRVLADLAGVQAESGQTAEAVVTFQKVVQTQEASGAFPLQQRIETFRQLAQLQEKNGQRDEAQKQFVRAEKLLEDSGLKESRLYADVLFDSGSLAEATGDPKAAESRYSDAMLIYRKLKSTTHTGAFLLISRLAKLRKDAADNPGALKWVEEGLAALAVDPPVNGLAWRLHPHSAELLSLKAEILLRSDAKSVENLKMVFQLMTTAGEIIDRLRFEQRSTPEAKLALIGNLQSETSQLHLVVCELLANADPAGGWNAAAFRVAEQTRARVFLEQLGRSRADLLGGLPSELGLRERKLAGELSRLRKELEGAEAAPFDQREPARIAGQQQALATARQSSEELQALIARDHPRVAALRRPLPCTLAEARSVLGKNEVAVLYCCGAKVSYAIVLPPPDAAKEDISLIPLAGTGEFEDDLEILASPETLKVAELYRDKAASLYRSLIAPVEAVVGDRDLLIVPDWKLGLVAFETLLDAKGRFLIESHAVRMGPSLTALHLNRLWDRQRSRPSRALLAMGDPVTSPADERLKGQPLNSPALRTAESTGEQFERLAHSGREVSMVADVFRTPPDDRWLGSEASEGRVQSWNSSGRLFEYRFLHFATHGILGGPDFPTALVLSMDGVAQGEEDGLLTVSEVSRLRLNADLVVLSACRSARGELHSGEGVTGLARAFLNSGTRGVVCSLWTVDDESTAAVMGAFYQQLNRGIPASAALRAEKQRMIREGKHPFDWAPFILIGSN